MAKSVRASVSKRNRANLRSTVFGPADNARTERLSAKLQEIAAQPKPNNQNKSNMELSKTRAEEQNGNIEAKPSQTGEDMDIDSQSRKTTASHSRQSGRIQKRNKRSRSSIVFRPHPSKAKMGSKRK